MSIIISDTVLSAVNISKQEEILTLSEVLVQGFQDEEVAGIKRFGIVDLWKIHSKKRNFSIYSNRV